MKERNLNFDKLTNRKNTDSIKFDFAKENGMPEDILPMWVADMDFKTSSFITDAINDKVSQGIFGYSESKDSYFEAVSGWMMRRHNLHIEKDWIVKTPGVVFALATAVKAYTNEGDSIIIQRPVYYPFTRVIVNNNRKAVSSDLVLRDGKYRIDYEDFEKKIVDNDVRMFILCSPHNPIGRVWEEDELERLADICLKHNVLIVSDEIHEDFTYDGITHIPLITIDEKYKEITTTCTSPAKTFNLAGLQVSNILIPNGELREKYEAEKEKTGYGLLNQLALTACEAAYRYGDEWLDELLVYLQGNLDYIREYLKSELPDIKLIEPEGTYLVWLDFRELGLTEEELEDLIVNKSGLWFDAGIMFGESGAGFERINIATQRSIIKEALDRIKKGLDDRK